MMVQRFSSDELVAALKAAGEPTRLRILTLLASDELNVKDLTQILGQSQPRISRHLKLLVEAGLIERFREGSWVYFHVSERTQGGHMARQILNLVRSDDSTLVRDDQRLQNLRREREQTAQAYFAAHASDWDSIRALHVPEGTVEAAIHQTLGDGPFDLFLDLGTGTGRMLEVFAPHYRRGLGLDVNQTMLSFAQSRLKAAGLSHAELRHGDLYNLSLPDASADAVIMHQVLHFLAEPGHAIDEAARVLAPGGKLVIVDFAPHEVEFLREQHAHERLGFADSQVQDWLRDAGLYVAKTHELRPSKSNKTQQLTVAIWSAERKGPSSKQATLNAVKESEEVHG
jgi:ubiquinone/menaquinone biosynthesis C-methylase UbiE/DNA-binding transcriptional ArsR family regulator